MTATITVNPAERRALVDHVIFEASQLGEGLDRASLNHVAIVRDMHARLGEVVRLLDALDEPRVPVTPRLRQLADALRRDALEAARGVDDPEDAREHETRGAHAAAVLARLDERAGGRC